MLEWTSFTPIREYNHLVVWMYVDELWALMNAWMDEFHSH